MEAEPRIILSILRLISAWLGKASGIFKAARSIAVVIMPKSLSLYVSVYLPQIGDVARCCMTTSDITNRLLASWKMKTTQKLKMTPKVKRIPQDEDDQKIEDNTKKGRQPQT